MTKFLKPIFLILGMATLLYNCQRDNVTDVSQTEIDNSAFKVRTVKLTEIPTIKSFLLEKSKNNIFSQKTIIDGAIFDQDNIMEVIDTLNQTNYSFKFTYPDTPKGVFYNLVVGKTSEGVLLEPYVLKYTTDSTYVEEFLSNNYDFSYFKGTVAVHKFTDYFTSNLGFKANATFCPPTYDAYGDPIPCDVVGLTGGGTGSGGGGSSGSNGFGPTNNGGGVSTGGGNYTGSGSASCTWTVTYLPCGCPGSNLDGHAQVLGVSCCHGSATVLTIYCPPSFKTNSGNKATGTTPCPDCPSGSNGGVGVNLPNPNKIVNNIKNLCAKQIFTELENGIFTQDPLKPEITIPSESIHLNLNQSVLKLFNDSQKFNYVVTNENMNGSNASTSFPSLNPISNSWDITTTISNTYLSTATRLSIARTMIHESVHAYLLYGQRFNPNRDLYTSLILYAKANGYNDPNRLHHEFMSQYINAMAYSLYEWDKNYGTGGNLGWNYYKSMAYGGLYYNDSNGNLVETDSFIALVPNAKDRLDIRNILINEQNGNSNAQGGKCN